MDGIETRYIPVYTPPAGRDLLLFALGVSRACCGLVGLGTLALRQSRKMSHRVTARGVNKTHGGRQVARVLERARRWVSGGQCDEVEIDGSSRGRGPALWAAGGGAARRGEGAHRPRSRDRAR